MRGSLFTEWKASQSILGSKGARPFTEWRTKVCNFLEERDGKLSEEHAGPDLDRHQLQSVGTQDEDRSSS